VSSSAELQKYIISHYDSTATPPQLNIGAFQALGLDCLCC